jgi:ATP-dependent Clp protease ATP-binding subunit ClpC
MNINSKGSVLYMMNYTYDLKNAIKEAKQVSIMYGSKEVTDDVLLYVLYRDEGYGLIKKALIESGFSVFDLKNLLNAHYDNANAEMQSVEDIEVSKETTMALSKAEDYAKKTDSEYLDISHVILALLESKNLILDTFFSNKREALVQLSKDLIEYILTDDITRYFNKNNKESSIKSCSKSIPKSILDCCEDLIQQALDGEIDPLVGREKEVNAIINTLSRRTKNNVLLTSLSGVGKTALVKGIALKIANGEIPALAEKRIFSLNLGSLMSGTTYRGQLESKLTDLIAALVKLGNCILFIDEMHSVMGMGSSEANKTDIAQLLKPHLTGRKLQVIGATTLKEIKTVEKDGAFARRFNIIKLEEPNEEDTFNILKRLAHKYEDFHKVIIPEETIRTTVRLSSRYITDRHQPDKAIDILDEAAARLKLDTTALEEKKQDKLQQELKELHRLLEETNDLTEVIQYRKDIKALELLISMDNLVEVNEQKADDNEEINKSNWPVLSADNIANIVEVRTGIPVSKLMQSDKQKLLRLEEEMHKQIVGQELAVKAVANAIRRNSSGLNDPNRPIASFIFSGPTGVGKTQVAKAIADLQFGSRDNIVRIDCSEYKEEHAIAKLIGAPAGYKGYGEGGQLTEAIRRQPYSVLLIDELEKAHANFSDILLQILDEGHLTDAEGIKVSFRNCIIIITTNLGSGLISQARPVGFGSNDAEEEEKAEYEQLKDRTMETIKKSLRPELINRVDEITVFHSLNKKHLRGIARILGKDLDKRLAEQNIVVKCSDAALDFISDNGYDKVYGARPLKRAITTYLEEPLSLMLLEDKIVPGDNIRVELEDNELIFYKIVDEELVPISPIIESSEA